MKFILFDGSLINFSMVTNLYTNDPNSDDRSWEIRIESVDEWYATECFTNKKERDDRFDQLIKILDVR